MAELTTAWMLGCVCGFFMGVTVAGRRRPTCRDLMRDPDRSGSGNCVPLPPAPPYSSTAIAWRAEEAQRAIDTSARIRRTAELYARLVDPSLGKPWDEGHTQRGNGSGGPTTPKPDIIPKPQFPSPRTIQGNQP